MLNFSSAWFTIIVILALLRGLVEGSTDNNPVVNPCAMLGLLQVRDAITIAIGLAGDISVWYNHSNVELNLLSPCSAQLAAQLPTRSDGTPKARVAIFRPMLEQLTLLRINNASYVQLLTDFPGNASLIVYAGVNSTIVSKPRSFLVPYGRVPEFNLILQFENGNLTHLLWENENCASCGANSPACVQGSCATAESICQNATSSNATDTTTDDSSPCRLGINIAFSGTDKNNRLLETWYQVSQVQKFSLSNLFLNAKTALLSGLDQTVQNVDQLIGG
ncbi:hypothetical protein O6H91_13G047500 [Diphasiastrum complanatum]|uniref:Uncharacterized protein n=1 Tax=Diphasiastrum complanatum TaxID=34168 RepID=A0ACC2BUF0_DIPCM|nr:hypothetical protein O6H91_13G047500 [Diphasiastrum complanatum]